MIAPSATVTAKFGACSPYKPCTDIRYTRKNVHVTRVTGTYSVNDQSRHLSPNLGATSTPAKCSRSAEGCKSDQAIPSHPSPSTRRDSLIGAASSTLLLSFLSHAFPSPAIGLPKPDVGPVVIRSFQTPSGVRVQEVVEGSGEEAGPGSRVEFNYVIRRSNGYYVFSTVDPLNGAADPVTFPLGQGKLISGLEEALSGMRSGGKRRALIPPSLGYVSRDLQPQPSEFGPLRALFAHSTEPLVFEIQVLKVR